jgi:hypothetical protein
VQTTAALRDGIGKWSPKTDAAPADVVLYALYQQRIYRLLSRDKRLGDATLKRVPRDLAGVSRDLLTAHRELYKLTPPLGVRAIKVGPALPAARCCATTAKQGSASTSRGTSSRR